MACGCQAILLNEDVMMMMTYGLLYFHTVHEYVANWNNSLCPASHVTLTFDLESRVRVTCDVDYLCANFSLPRPLSSRLRPDVRDMQTDVRHNKLCGSRHNMPPPLSSLCGRRSTSRRRADSGVGVGLKVGDKY